MFVSKTLIALFVAVAASARVVPRKQPPSSWWVGLENYTVYHTRYLALDCQDNHGKPFFDACCHPLLKNQSLSTRPQECTPSASASISASSAEPTSTEATPDDNDDSEDCDSDDGDGDDDDCDDAAGDEDSSSASPVPTSETSSAPASTHSSSSVTSTHATPSPTEHNFSPSSSSSAAASSSSTASSGSLITGGFATFFYQGGAAGACGTVHSDSDLIAAIDIARYGNTGGTSSLCGKQVRITNTDNKKSVVVTIADACPGCKNSNSIDLSTGAFDKIADESTGEVPNDVYPPSSQNPLTPLSLGLCFIAMTDLLFLSAVQDILFFSLWGSSIALIPGGCMVPAVTWLAGDALEPTTYASLLQASTAVVHTLGTLLEDAGYKDAVQRGDPLGVAGSLIKSLSGRGAGVGNPLAEGAQRGSYEVLNRDAALAVCATFASASNSELNAESDSTDAAPRKPFIYVSAEDIFRPFVPGRYIKTKREAERGIRDIMHGRSDLRAAFIRPSESLWIKYNAQVKEIIITYCCYLGLVYHSHFRPLTTPIATLLDLSSTLHHAAPANMPTPSSVLRALGSAFSPSPAESPAGIDMEPSPLASVANALSVPPIHVDHVAEAICKVIQDPSVEGVVDVQRMRQLIGWTEKGQSSDEQVSKQHI
ncbi:hypothetical protein EW145_g7079 [Phellinidium pouzarii]|uniref:RlpA-like protein double-psi beta-barrel domain-containing protein n=1 Tax=Phellinidium pouzarii TaxID=167371 RepID=A0A4S4KPC2_9AGAM|nr:hypothetical protein EW145_g7079 [Phellinidium pouzarii]